MREEGRLATPSTEDSDVWPIVTPRQGSSIVPDGTGSWIAPRERARPPLLRIAARRKRSVVFLDATEVWAFEADARLTFVHCAYGKLDIDVSLAEIESSALGASFVRVHRSWLANLGSVKTLEHDPGGTQLFVGKGLTEGAGIRIPVSRDRVRAVREALLASAIGIRRRDSSDD